MKYRYLGESEVNLPVHKITVKKGDVIEVEQEIDNPDFELVKEEVKETKKETK